MDAIIIGDGPGGLSAALFLAKAGLDVTVYGQDRTAMHAAQLKNYLGVPDIHGSDLQRIARAQAEAFGAHLVSARVESVGKDWDGFHVTLQDGTQALAPFVVLSEGKSPRLAKQLGVRTDERGAVVVDLHGRTSVAGVYAVGRLVRPGRSQAIISAGEGAAAALDILSVLKRAPVQDWDSPPEAT